MLPESRNVFAKSKYVGMVGSEKTSTSDENRKAAEREEKVVEQALVKEGQAVGKLRVKEKEELRTLLREAALLWLDVSGRCLDSGSKDIRTARESAPPYAVSFKLPEEIVISVVKEMLGSATDVYN